MSLSQINALLYQAIGLDVALVGTSLVERAVKDRITANDLRDISQYTDLLLHSEPELQSLVEAVVVPETFFFRYPESFVALRQIVESQLPIGTRTVRALSVPCSTGEEPYSIAMTLLEAGLSAKQFEIDAIDVSSRSLDIAIRAHFGNNSFRGSNLRFRDLFFEKVGAGFRLFDRVRQCVKFESGNVLENHFRFNSEPYDFIFCRNLLIYFDSRTQTQALNKLSEILSRDGLLFVGSGEAGLLKQHGFSSAKLPMAFAFRRSQPIFSDLPPKPRKPKVCLPALVIRTKADSKPDLPTPKKALVEIKRQSSGTADLAVAERLADKGQLGEAAEICQASLREQGPSARAFHLLGLIRDGAGDHRRASEFYGKALYLEPDHYHSLIHLSLLKDKIGEDAAAKVLKKRALGLLEREP
jgi:chemotaxis protein methyltransferase WspC